MALRLAVNKGHILHQPKATDKPSTLQTLVSSGFVYSVVNYAANKYLAVMAAPILPEVAEWRPESFNLDLSGVAAIVGGEEAVAATVAAFTTGNTWWIAPYTPPGAYVVAKYFGQTIQGNVWKGIFPGERKDLAEALNLHRTSKYLYYGLESGTERLRPSSNVPDCLVDEDLVDKLKGKHEHASTHSITGSKSQGFTTGPIYDLLYKSRDLKQSHEDMVVKKVLQVSRESRGKDNLIYIFQANDNGWKFDERNKDKEVTIEPNRKHRAIGTLAFLANVAILIFLGLVNDWYAFGIIAGSMVCNFCFMGSVGSCKITVAKHGVKSKYLPPGHGILSHETENAFIAVFGTEDAVNNVTKTKLKVAPRHSFSTRLIGTCCILMQLLFLAQLIITPQATFAGQISFLGALLIGWLANAYYSSLDSTRAQRQIVRKHCGAELVTILRGNRTANLVTLAFLTGMKEEAISKVYPSLLAGSKDWRDSLQCISSIADSFNGVPSNDLKLPEKIEGFHLAPDIYDAHAKALALREKPEIKKFLDFLIAVRKECTPPAEDAAQATTGNSTSAASLPEGNGAQAVTHRNSNPAQDVVDLDVLATPSTGSN
ncbi:hypothetical protein Unana1_08332 [Umbelopsis nana]